MTSNFMMLVSSVQFAQAVCIWKILKMNKSLAST